MNQTRLLKMFRYVGDRLFSRRTSPATRSTARARAAFFWRSSGREHEGSPALAMWEALLSAARPPTANYETCDSGATVSVAVGNDPAASPAHTPQLLFLEGIRFTIIVAESGCSKRRRLSPHTLLCVKRKVQVADIFKKSFSSGDKFASVRARVGLHGDRSDVTNPSCVQPAVALSREPAPPTVCIALPQEMPAPSTMTGHPSGSKDSAGCQGGVQNYVIHSDDDVRRVGRETQWFAVSRQLA